MDNNIYLHAIDKDYPLIYNEKTLIKILTVRNILSLRMQNKNYDFPSFNGVDYISLCDYDKRDVFNEKRGYNAFNSYVKNSLSFAFSKDSIDVIKPQLVKPVNYNNAGYKFMGECGLSEDIRYSDLPDEVQVKDSLSIDKSCGILYPCNEFLESCNSYSIDNDIKKLKFQINYLRKLLYSYNCFLKIYDVSTFGELTDKKIESIVLTKHL